MQTAVIPIAVSAALRQNVVTVNLLALCPMLAVSVSVAAAAALGLLTTLVMLTVGAAAAALRHRIPAVVRLPVLLIMIAATVAALELLLAAYAAPLSRQLGIFLPLIITNCAVLARLEVFASRQPPLAAAIDGAASGLGMTAALVLLALLRELLGSGDVAGVTFLPASATVALALLPAGGFILFGLLLALLNGMRWRGQ